MLIIAVSIHHLAPSSSDRIWYSWLLLSSVDVRIIMLLGDWRDCIFTCHYCKLQWLLLEKGRRSQRLSNKKWTQTLLPRTLISELTSSSGECPIGSEGHPQRWRRWRKRNRIDESRRDHVFVHRLCTGWGLLHEGCWWLNVRIMLLFFLLLLFLLLLFLLLLSLLLLLLSLFLLLFSFLFLFPFLFFCCSSCCSCCCHCSTRHSDGTFLGLWGRTPFMGHWRHSRSHWSIQIEKWFQFLDVTISLKPPTAPLCLRQCPQWFSGVFSKRMRGCCRYSIVRRSWRFGGKAIADLLSIYCRNWIGLNSPTGRWKPYMFFWA